MEGNAVFVSENIIRINGEDFRAGEYFSYFSDCKFVKRTSDKEINKNGYNGLYYDMSLTVVGFITTSPDNKIKIAYFKPETKIKGLSSFTKLIRTFKQTCGKHENYNYYDLFSDIKEGRTTENKGPIKEVIISKDNLNERMYY